MAANTKFGLAVVLFFIIGMAVLLSRQVNRGQPVERSRGTGLARLVPQRSEPDLSVGDYPTALAGVHLEVEPPGPARPDGRVAGGMVLPPARAMTTLAVVERGGEGRAAEPMPPTADASREPAAPAPVAPAPVIPSLADITTDRLIPPAAAAPVGWVVHRVQPGETLGDISTKYYQTCKRYDVIFQANRDRLTSADRLRSGMELRIPAPVAAAAVVADRPASGNVPAAASPGRLLNSPLLAPVDRRDEPSGARLLAQPHATAGPAGLTYTVRPGDTLYSIARQILGSSRQWALLYETNKDIIPDSNRLAVGQVLRVPATRVAMHGLP